MPAHGRHRRYRPNRISQTSLTVTAGGAGIALPFVGVSGASAVPVETWDGVAECESANHWSINTGNGFYGGLQFTQSTWEEYSGTQYAERADLATKDQQIAVAEKVLAVQGPGAWPACSVHAGLTRGGHPSQINPAAHKAASADRTKPEAYTVVSGDTLFAIARIRGIDGGWQRLYEDNREVIGGNPDLIFPGQRLTLERKEKRKGEEKRKATEATGEPRSEEQADRQRQSATPGFTAPVTSAAPSTPYRAPGSGWSSGYHTGVDFPVATGTSVTSIAGGQVVSAGWDGAYGYQVVIRHADGKYSQYAHLSALSVGVGQPVNSGQRIGRSGSTGNTTGPHLHFEVRTGPGYGSDVDPLVYLRGKGVAI